MKDGICPKCDARTVHTVAGNRFELSIQVSTLSRALLCAFVCTTCGYVEQYIDDTRDLPKLAERWPQVPPPSGA